MSYNVTDGRIDRYQEWQQIWFMGEQSTKGKTNLTKRQYQWDTETQTVCETQEPL